MGIEDTNVISKKSRRKMDKKENKYKHLISQVPGTEYSPEPTKFLMLCNTGLVSGFDEAQAVQIFSEYGRLESVTMLPGKSFCFVTFTDIHDARNAFENVNGKIKLQKMLGPIYMIYTTSAPSSEMERSAKRPNGLHVLENFITEEEERNLVNCINFSETTQSGNPTLLKNRRVKHYGYEFQYSNNNVNRSEKLPDDLPSECNILQEKLRRHGWENPKWPPHQLTVNEYQPGQGIPPHVDTHSAFESPIMSLSLLSDIVMEFKHSDGSHYPLHLPRRSMLIMDEEARYGWTHAIRPRKLDVIYATGPKVIERGLRISFTFRWLREEAVCRCSYRDQCDSQAAESTKNFDSEAARLEFQHVHQVYNKISSHFSQTRYRAWPNVAEFVTSLPLGSVLFDVGCGNGKYFGLNQNIFELGSDRSDGLLAECRQRGGFESVQCDCLRLPLLDRCVDGLICIAVIHHLATRDRRVEAVREMARVLRVGGRGLVYVWAKDQQRGNVQSKYLRGEGVKEGGGVKREELKEEEVGEGMVKRKKENAVKEEEEEKDGEIVGGMMVEVGKVEVEEEEEEEENENVVRGMKQGKKEYAVKEKRKKETVVEENEKQVEEEKSGEFFGKVKEMRMKEGKEEKEKKEMVMEIVGEMKEERKKVVGEKDEEGDEKNEEIIVGVKEERKKEIEKKRNEEETVEDRRKKIIKEEEKVKKNEEIVGEVKEEVKKENVRMDGGSSKHSHTVQKKCGNSEENMKKADSKSCKNDKVSEFSLPVHNNRTQFKHDDILVPWTNKKETFFRYYHVFKEGELEELCSFVSEIKVEKVYYDQGNWCVVFVKC